MLNILSGDVFLIIMMVGVHGDGYNDLMEEAGTYSALSVLFNGRKWYLRCVGCVVGLFEKECGRF